MELIRTFHPIGQGAFYSERHNFNGTNFTIVYDCGTLTFNEKEREPLIISSFSKGHIIDILFISHFHADHINGIETLSKHCTIKRVVLPLIDDTEKALLRVSNFFDMNYSDIRLIDSPESFFGTDVPIIRIEPTEIDSYLDNNGINEPNDISTIKNSNKFQSGTAFMPIAGIEWFFIPYNYENDTRRKQFISALRANNLKLGDIDTIDNIIKNKSAVYKAYKAVGNLNENSMILYSGKNKIDYICGLGYFPYFNFEYQSGCLYMGDVNLKRKNVVQDINTKLNKQLPFIGTIQIPHHGSIHNFENTILQQNYWCAVFSFGTTNNEGHPSDKVIEEVVTNNTYPYFVTEDKHSILVQWK